VLPRDALVIRDHHVARLKSVHAVAGDAVANDYAHVRDEVGNTAGVLRQQPAARVEQAAAVVAHLVDHHVARGALHHLRHLVGDCRQRVPDDLEGNDVDRRHGHG